MSTAKKEDKDQEEFSEHSAKGGGKGEKRLFQIGDEHKELTKAEAEKHGFYWREENGEKS